MQKREVAGRFFAIINRPDSASFRNLRNARGLRGESKNNRAF
jgi:hypothetical protein